LRIHAPRRHPEDFIHQPLGLGTRDEHPLVNIQRQMPERRTAHRIGEWSPALKPRYRFPRGQADGVVDSFGTICRWPEPRNVKQRGDDIV